ncbi:MULTISPECIES: GvpL/GvpF family gas vesicle protein [unclassified Rhodococcus (in: high G+C Gram-positive bacteria)]|uniref:GvpL/GvpF family gas vesicle protein n=1 Tax=unclassified Rhodococcus (in: high G+C Gram-positive bacteria) TaxID=192944 RepID=UPI000E0C2BD4|nr:MULTISPECIES: GvpL/GvpF family gas vesicle protein [unclassified Rhodococcus (in: high G+C Gram-positive bacteria)]QKT11864.1 GvpL/GvpF family gas vesicle protein [Rhodococcus sp. W8901]RDI21111.1 gas vesicle protein GvpL/GvpF [Rhodococcus sp. AG1013]
MNEEQSAPEERRPVVYVYGLVPADVEVKEDATGIGSPPRPLKIVTHDDVAALVSEIDPNSPLGSSDDLRAHAAVLDATVTAAPVLPLRFGAVLTDTDAVVSELLEQYRDEFHDALEQLEGMVQFVVKGRYVEDAILREILSDDPEAGRLREAIRDQTEDVTRDERLALGELISRALTGKREQDTQRIVEAVEPVAAAVSAREPTDDEEAGSVAVLIPADRTDELEEAVAPLIDEWQGRIDVTVTGPLAAYDFVKTRAPGT